MHCEESNQFRNVLVVDDDPAMVRIISRFVEAEGYIPTPAMNGCDALSILQNRQFHFLVTDLDMPHMDGVELCRAMRALNLPRYVYSLILTGSKTDHLRESLIAGADDFMIKPINRGELLARMYSGHRVLELEDKLQHLVSFDELTEVLNRRTLFEQFDIAWKQQYATDDSGACVMVDVDHFKHVNDTYGHIAGDEVLRGISRVLQEVFSDTQLIGRYGGEEFCIVLMNTVPEHVTLRTEQARSAIEKAELEYQGTPIHVTASFGVACRPLRSTTPQELLKDADAALLEAKRTGRNRILFSASDLGIPILRVGSLATTGLCE